MSRAIVFQTPGILDLRAITCMGVNTKPNTQSPIGFFGTGLKFAVAVLTRHEIPLTVVTDGEVYAFYRKTERFRDKDFDFVRMKRQNLARTLQSRAQYSELSYTTELGKQWKLWQVFRELYSNTLDELGSTYAVEDLEDIVYEPDQTYIVVVSDAFAAEYDNRDQHFLPDGLRVQQQNQKLQVLDRPSSYIYYRGMRVYDLEKPSAVTYNFLDGLELTEDRTAKNSYMLRHYIERYILSEAPPDITAKVVQASRSSFEASLSYTGHSVEPSAEFVRAASHSPVANPTATMYVRSKQIVSDGDPLSKWPRPWRAEGDYIVDRDGNTVLRAEAALTPLQLSYVAKLLSGKLSQWDLEDWAAEQDTENAAQYADLNATDSVLDAIPF